MIANELGKGTVTNVYGFYSLSLQPGFYQLTFSYIGYEDQTRAVNLNQDLSVNLELREDIQELEEDPLMILDESHPLD